MDIKISTPIFPVEDKFDRLRFGGQHFSSSRDIETPSSLDKVYLSEDEYWELEPCHCFWKTHYIGAKVVVRARKLMVLGRTNTLPLDSSNIGIEKYWRMCIYYRAILAYVYIYI